MDDSTDLRLPYGEGADQFVDVYMPSGRQLGTVLLIHGGYWRDKYALDLMVPLAVRLSELGWAVLNVEYRRLEEGGPPVWLEMSSDIAAAVELAPTHPIIALGHSAGGHLALWAATNPGLIDAVIALAPLSDLRAADSQNLSDGVVRRLLGGSAAEVADRYDDASPIERLPLSVPQVVVHGSADESVPQQMSIDYVAAARAAGDDVTFHELDKVDHMALVDPESDAWSMVEDQLAQWGR